MITIEQYLEQHGDEVEDAFFRENHNLSLDAFEHKAYQEFISALHEQQEPTFSDSRLASYGRLQSPENC